MQILSIGAIVKNVGLMLQVVGSSDVKSTLDVELVTTGSC
jgi:hypothetical protein